MKFYRFLEPFGQVENLTGDHLYYYDQIRNTYLCLVIVGITLFIYTVSYLIIGNMVLVLVNGANILLLCMGFVFFLRKPEKRKAFTANLILILLFLNAYPVSLLTGGIKSSTIVWFTIFPAIMVFMNGIKNAAIWFAVSFTGYISLLIFKDINKNALFISSETVTERFLDISMLTFTITLIISMVDLSKRRTLKKLGETRKVLRVLATIDPLTELLNRRFFIERSESEINRAKRYHTSLTVLMLDLDYFKRINDNFGHKAGDNVLVEVSKALKKSVRDIDLVGRYGGEEFIILCPESDSASSLQVARRIREDIENLSLELNTQPVRMTISIGVAVEASGENLSLDTLIQHADEALYRSKEIGRNCVTEWQGAV